MVQDVRRWLVDDFLSRKITRNIPNLKTKKEETIMKKNKMTIAILNCIGIFLITALILVPAAQAGEITSPFTRKMSLKHLNLTPTEIRIANLIRHGSSNKKIAELMNISPRTVDTHRKNIRRKIGLDQKRANLRSYLLSLH